MTCKQTHEAFIASVAAMAIARLADPVDIAAVGGIKLVFGAGINGVRGITYFNRWKPGETEAKPFVEIAAFTKESWVQLAGTTIHELGHVLAGWEAGHAKPWHEACERLGLRRIRAAGTSYCLAHFAPELRLAIASLAKPDDGEPVQSFSAQGLKVQGKGCQAGVGTRGGKSRGAGSGSRLRLFECECVPPVKARVARDEFQATCQCCSSTFRFIK